MICWNLHRILIESVHTMKTKTEEIMQVTGIILRGTRPLVERPSGNTGCSGFQQLYKKSPTSIPDSWHCTAAVHPGRHRSYFAQHQREGASSSSLIDCFVVVSGWGEIIYNMPRGTVSYVAVPLGRQGHDEAGVSPGSFNYDVILSRRKEWWWKPGPIDS